MKYKKIFLGISGVLVLISIISLALWGLNPAIDFTGGSLIEVVTKETSSQIPNDEITAKIQEVEGISVNSVQYSSETNSYLIRTPTIQESQKVQILEKLNDSYGQIEERRFETVGPTLGRELLYKTLMAVLLAAIAIMSYVAYQFKDKYFGISAILAMFHDTIILLGVFSILGYFYGVEVDALFVTAVLTTLSFSVHDTIVVFDRIRETNKFKTNQSLDVTVNASITQTLPRSLNNSLTIIIMLLTLFLLGGVTIKWFVFALFIGTIAGTYSSPFVAAPILLILMKRKK